MKKRLEKIFVRGSYNMMFWNCNCFSNSAFAYVVGEKQRKWQWHRRELWLTMRWDPSEHIVKELIKERREKGAGSFPEKLKEEEKRNNKLE